MQSENNFNDYEIEKSSLVLLTCTDGSRGINWLPPENRSSPVLAGGLGLLRLFRKGLGEGETDEEVRIEERVREKEIREKNQMAWEKVKRRHFFVEEESSSSSDYISYCHSHV